MAEKTLIERATIKFKHDLTLDEVKDMLEVISQQLHASIRYVSTCHGDVYPKGARVKKEQGSFKVGGSIGRNNPELVSDVFETESSERNCQKASALRFNLIPGYEEADYRRETLNFWDEARRAVDVYFQKRSNDQDCSA